MSVSGTGNKLAQNEGDEYKGFEAVFPHIVDTLTQEEGIRLNSVMQHYRKVLEYNVPFGKRNRGLAAIAAYRILRSPQAISKEELYNVQIMGWCIEMLQAFFLILDDVMDQSYTRRGRPCWFRKEGVGLVAVNDGVYVENAIYKIFKLHFKHMPYYVDILDLFHDISLKTSYGQCLDLLSCGDQKSINFSEYTQENYATIVEYKTAYYSFYLPIAAAMYMSGIKEPAIHAQAKDVLAKMGHYFQVQDDFLDCFGNPETTGKVGTDIQEGKCSWLIVTALQRADAATCQALKENYGRQDPECVKRVTEIYRSLQIPAIYADYEQQTHMQLTNAFKQPTFKLPASVFEYYLNQIYKRNA